MTKKINREVTHMTCSKLNAVLLEKFMDLNQVTVQSINIIESIEFYKGLGLILIVEDDERLANLTKDYLESNGLQVSIEGDGSRAIERIKTEQPDLVVLPEIK